MPPFTSRPAKTHAVPTNHESGVNCTTSSWRPFFGLHRNFRKKSPHSSQNLANTAGQRQIIAIGTAPWAKNAFFRLPQVILTSETYWLSWSSSSQVIRTVLTMSVDFLKTFTYVEAVVQPLESCTSCVPGLQMVAAVLDWSANPKQ